MIIARSRLGRDSRRAFPGERVAARQILGAPFALADDVLLLNGPDALRTEEPARFADAVPALPPPADPAAPVIPDPVPLDPADDPLSPVGDPGPGDGVATMSTASCGCGPTITVSVTEAWPVDEETPSVAGWFRFHAVASCTVGAPSSAGRTTWCRWTWPSRRTRSGTPR